jgi:hypothetical protein
MFRTTQISYPDGGQTNFSYPNANQVNISEKTSSSANRVSNLLVDGLGREIQRNTTNGDAIPYDQLDTCYDGLGREGGTDGTFPSIACIGFLCVLRALCGEKL